MRRRRRWRAGEGVTAKGRFFPDLSEIAGTLWDHAIGLKGNATCMRRGQPMPARARLCRPRFEPEGSHRVGREVFRPERETVAAPI